MKRTVGLIMIIIMISKVTGFLREMAIASTFGASLLADVYKSSLIVPGVVVSLFAAGLNAALIPILSSAEANQQKDRFFRNFLSIIGILSIVAFVLITIFAKPLTHLFVPGYSPDKLQLTVQYTRLVAIITPLQVLSYTLIAWLQQGERFYIAALVAIPMNLIIILGAYLNPSGNILPVIIATIVGYTAQFVWVLWPYLQSKPKLELRPTIHDHYLRMFWVMIVPVLLTLAAGQINILVDFALASGLSDGMVSNMDYANKVNVMFQSVLVLSLSSVLFTKQSKLSSEDNRKEVFLITKQNLSILLMIMIPISLGTMFLSREIMTLLFVRGRYTLDAARIGGWILFFYAPSIVTRALMEIFGKMFFSLKMSRKPMMATFITIGVNIILNFILVRVWGVYGLAIATAIASLVGVAVIAYQTRRMFHEEGLHLMSHSYVKFALAGLAMFGVLVLLRLIIPMETLHPLIVSLISAVLGAGIYFGLLYYLKEEEFFQVMAQVKQRFMKKIP